MRESILVVGVVFIEKGERKRHVGVKDLSGKKKEAEVGG